MGQKDFPRQKRVNEEIRRVLGRLIQQLDDPRLGLVTVTEVSVNRDYSLARVYVSIMGNGEPEEGVAALTHAGSLLRRQLAHGTVMRTTPRLQFVLDNSAARAERIQDLIDRGLPDDD